MYVTLHCQAGLQDRDRIERVIKEAQQNAEHSDELLFDDPKFLIQSSQPGPV